MKRTSFQLKQIAKNALIGRYGLPIGVYLLSSVITLAVATFVSNIFQLNSIVSVIIYFIVTLIVELLSSVLLTGLTAILLDMSRGGAGQFGDLFYGFKHQTDHILLAIFVKTILTNLCMLPSVIIYYLAAYRELPILFMIAAILTVAGIIPCVLISLAYALIVPLYIDCPEKSASELLRESRMLMTGNKGRCLYLELSFIGLYILGIFSCFIGFLWIMPYVEMTHVQFYRDIIREI